MMEKCDRQGSDVDHGDGALDMWEHCDLRVRLSMQRSGAVPLAVRRRTPAT